jgi:hypothetical protein
MHSDFIEIAKTGVIDGRARGRATTAAVVHDGSFPDDDEGRLASHLYGRWYTRSGSTAPIAKDVASERDFLATLSAANRTAHVWRSGVVSRSTARYLEVIHSGVTFFALPEEVRRDSADRNQMCAVLLPAERLNMAAGFYLFFGATEDNRPPNRPSVRLYWHLTADAGPLFVAAVSSVLNQRGIPFAAKTLSAPVTYRRADAGIVYLAADDLVAAQEPVGEIYARLEHALRPSGPMWARKIRPGLALACDPGTGRSFGQEICTVVARALLRDAAGSDAAAELRGADSRLRAIAAMLAAESIDGDKPYLYQASGPVAESIEAFEPHGAMTSTPGSAVGLSPPFGATHGDRDMLLRAASGIGQEIVEHAIWNDSYTVCNWMSRVVVPPTQTANGYEVCAQPMGPELYDGLSGVALFLSQLHRVTGDPSFKHAARAAIACALQQLSFERARERVDGLGLYSGATGVVYAAARISRELELDFDETLSDNLVRAASEHPWNNQNDLVSGRSGLIVGLLELHSIVGSRACADLAIRFGTELSRRLLESGNSQQQLGTQLRVISGMSHGAAGLGAALLRLYATAADHNVLAAARIAYQHEEELFDETEQNWPDLRPDANLTVGNGESSFLTAWCCGAPGLSMALGLASRIDTARANRYRSRLDAALRTTSASVSARTPIAVHDASLCHGLSGLVEAMWQGASDFEMLDYRELSMSLGGELAAQWLANEHLTCGVSGRGSDYSLMLGFSGVGLTFLRLLDAEVPGALFPISAPSSLRH